MPDRLDPLVASDRIESDYRSYLTTSFAPLDSALRKDVVTALAQPGRLRKGPYLQATPPYKPGISIRRLVDEGVLHGDFLSGQQQALPADRALYLHQERALRRAGDGSNLIVATGTGSGKTECYLIPVLDSLLREREAGTLSRPGVRAMLLYPMNALANDQMKRIREVFAPYPEITFGRYVGDTEQEARFRSRLEDPMRRWKLSSMDLESIIRWEDYSRAKDQMLVHTDIPEAPWWVVESDDKRRARLNMIHHVLTTMDYREVQRVPLDLPPRPPSSGYVRPPRDPNNYVPDYAATLDR